MLKNILVTGAKGQLGKSIQYIQHHYPGHKFYYSDIDDTDICNVDALEKLMQRTMPDVVINCAAYTAVDKAEEEPVKALDINAKAVKSLAEICKRDNVFLIHISTDYVFDGNKNTPYREEDATCPMSAYGHSKLEGEIAILYHLDKALIIRTSWLYAPFGKNFVKTILEKGATAEPLYVVYDQIGSPTYAIDLAHAILSCIPEAIKLNGVEIVHYANEGVASWFDIAKSILKYANLNTTVHAVTSEKYQTKAKRPPYSVMNVDKFKKLFNTVIPYWNDSLAHCLEIIKK